jgi:hypothetical protein
MQDGNAEEIRAALRPASIWRVASCATISPT